MSDTVALRPLLARYPDARRGTSPLVDPILFPYLGLIFGFGAGAIVLTRGRYAEAEEYFRSALTIELHNALALEGLARW